MTASEPERLRPVTVTVIDDHDVVHAGIEAWCAQADPPIEVVGCYESPTAYQARPTDAPNADVVLLDLQFIGNRPEFAVLEKLVDAGQPVIVYSHMLSDEVILEDEPLAKVRGNAAAKDLLTALADTFEGLSDWSADAAKHAIGDTAQANGAKPGQLMFPTRLALSGKGGGPDLGDILAILGKDESVKRLRSFAEKL